MCFAVLTDLLQAFDCLKHDILTGKLHTFVFNFNSLREYFATIISKQIPKNVIYFYYFLALNPSMLKFPCTYSRNTEKRRTLFKGFVDSQFNYCPLVWLFDTKELNNRINGLHERALRIIYQDRFSLFEKLLKIDKSVSILQSIFVNRIIRS